MKQVKTARWMSVFALACGTLALSGSAHANTEVTGTVQAFESVSSYASAPGNGDLRVWLNGVPAICPGATDGSWGFVNANDANFKGIMTTVALAFSMGKSILIGSQLQAIGTGSYCGINYVRIMG